MMKKVLALIIVLGMVSVTSAALQISVYSLTGGETWDPLNPEDSEITLEPSDYLLLGIWTDAAIPDSITWALYCDTSLGIISGGAYVGPDDGGDIYGFNYEPASAFGVIPPVGEDGIMGGIAVFGGNGVLPDTVLYDQILFHCEAEGDTLISLGLVNSDTGEIIEVMDSVIIHQVPEPATIALLGLGGLLLRRKK